LPTKSVSTHQAELGRIEHQNSAQLQSKSKPSGKTSATASHLHPETTHPSGINFNYHAPRNQGSTSTAKKH
jgi:hypothetical protein